MADTMPWEDYQGASQGGPWQDYSPAPAAPVRFGQGNMDQPLANNPMAGMSFLQNALYGVGEAGANIGTGLEQLYARATGNQPLLDQLMARTASDRQLYAPVNASAGGKVGQFAENTALTAPLSMTGVGSLLSGAALGGLQPVASTAENSLTNAALGGALSLGGYGVGKALGGWAASRAGQPFMGWGQGTVNRAATEAIGQAGAEAPTQSVVNDAFNDLGDIFNRAQSPSTSVALGQNSLDTIISAGQKYGSKALDSQPEVQELLGYASKGSANAQELGNLADRMRIAAQSEIGSKTGDKALGNALYAERQHVLDQIQGAIPDSDLAAQYAAARPQYRTLLDLTGRPTILNSASGDVNATALGKYLQRADRFGYARGNNTSPLYQAARWGQEEGMGKGMPEFDIAKLGLPTLKYLAINNPLSRAVGGVASRALSPVSGALPAVGGGLGSAAEPAVGAGIENLIPGLRIGLPGTPLPYLEQ